MKSVGFGRTVILNSLGSGPGALSTSKVYMIPSGSAV